MGSCIRSRPTVMATAVEKGRPRALPLRPVLLAHRASRKQKSAQGQLACPQPFRTGPVEWRKSTVADSRFATSVSGSGSPASDPPHAHDSSIALAVSPGKVGSLAEPSDRRLVAEGRVSSLMVVVPQPSVKSCSALPAVTVDRAVGPGAQERADESLPSHWSAAGRRECAGGGCPAHGKRPRGSASDSRTHCP
jgi:hypothetical protein